MICFRVKHELVVWKIYSSMVNITITFEVINVSGYNNGFK